MKKLGIHCLIERAIKYCVSHLGMKEMGIENIGAENGDVVNFDSIDRHFYDAGLVHTRFEAFTWEDRYRLLREVDKPEYVLDHICRLGYIEKKKTGVVISYYESELAETLESLAKKYSKRKVNALKKRLGIKSRMPKKAPEKNEGIITKPEMDNETTYLLCPDPECVLFFDTAKMHCEAECPRIDELAKIIRCHNCGEPVELPGTHSRIQSVTHDCADGRHPLMFQRMSGKYMRIYEMPK